MTNEDAGIIVIVAQHYACKLGLPEPCCMVQYVEGKWLLTTICGAREPGYVWRYFQDFNTKTADIVPQILKTALTFIDLLEAKINTKH